MAGYKRSKVLPGSDYLSTFFLAYNTRPFTSGDVPHLLQALLKPLQKNPAMGPRVLAKRLMAAQWMRKGEGRPR